MAEAHSTSYRSPQPQLKDLLEQYLQRQVSAHALGLGAGEATSEVVPFDAAPTRPVDARLAWDGAVAAMRYLNPNFQTKNLRAPAQWPAVVAAAESTASVAFCLGNFPQMVHALQPLLNASDLSALRPSGQAGAEFVADRKDAKAFPQVLLSLGLLRLACKFDEAQEWLRGHRQSVPSEWQAVWANEEAALSWHAGRAPEALKIWQTQPPTAPILFNRGMAALFTNDLHEARALLSDAVAQISEDDPWHHLGRLYLALAQMQR